MQQVRKVVASGLTVSNFSNRGCVTLITRVCERPVLSSLVLAVMHYFSSPFPCFPVTLTAFAEITEGAVGIFYHTHKGAAPPQHIPSLPSPCYDCVFPNIIPLPPTEELSSSLRRKGNKKYFCNKLTSAITF